MFSSILLNTLIKSNGNRLLLKNVEIIARNTHKAATLKEIGKPLVLENVKTVQHVKDDEVRIKVHYCSLNSTDVQLWSGKHPDLKVTLPLIPGHEFSGEIEEIGKNNPNSLNIGDRVVAMNDLLDPNGGLTSQTVIKSRDCWEIPQDLSLKECAVLPYGHGTALLTFSKYCDLKENDIILITTGPGGMGLAAIEVAVSVYKAKVIAICDTESSSDLVRQKGAHKAVSMGKNFTKLYKNISDAMGGTKAKVAYDAVGKGMLHLLADFVDPATGQLISVDPFYCAEKFKAQKPEYEVPKKKEKAKKEEDTCATVKLLQSVKHIDLYEHPDEETYRQMIYDTLTLCEEGLISGHISQTFKLNDIQSAIEFIQKKQCTGKVLIDVQGTDCEAAKAD